MAQIQVTNTQNYQALRGTDVLIQVSQTQNASISTLALGTKVTISSSGNVGYVSEIPFGGYFFFAKPLDPSKRMDSVQPGILLANEIITLG